MKVPLSSRIGKSPVPAARAGLFAPDYIRLFVAEHAGMSIRTVDRRLADARRTGLLPPYRHAQGKHGKSPAKESRNE